MSGIVLKGSGHYLVDLDSSLAYHTHKDGIDTIGEPIPAMLDRVLAYLALGADVRIFTARATHNQSPYNRKLQIEMIEAWCLKHIGSILPVTCSKDYETVEIWDDRAKTVLRNQGTFAEDSVTHHDGFYVFSPTGPAPHFET